MTFELSRRGLLHGAAAVAAGSLLTACAGTADPVVAATVNGPPKRGGRLRAAFIGGSTENPSPLMSTLTAIDYVRARVVWDCLGELDEEFRPRWRLAEEVRSNADATVWTIRLRDGVAFTGGGPVTAADVLFSLRMFVENRAPQGAALSEVDWKNSRAKDDRTLVLALTAPNAFLDVVLTQSMFVFPAGTKDFAQASGSGPYVPVNYAAGRGSLLRRNPNYWLADAAYLDELELVSIADPAARLNALKAGQIDYASAVPLTAARAEQDNRELTVHLPDRPAWVQLAVTANLTQNPFTDQRIAQALRLAVDRDTLVRIVTLGFGEIANDLLGKHSPYYDDSLPQRAYDPDRAKALLAEAGMSGLSVHLRTGDYEYGMTESAVLLADQAKAAGITLTLDKIPAADYYSDFRTVLATALQSVNYHARPIALDILNLHDRTATMPLSGKPSPEKLALVTRMRTATTEEKKTVALRDVQRHLYELGGDVVFARLPQPMLASTRVHGVQARGLAGFPSFTAAWLA